MTAALCTSVQLETAAYAGSAVVVAVIAIIVVNCWQHGFPAIRSKELPVWSMRVGFGISYRTSHATVPDISL